MFFNSRVLWIEQNIEELRRENLVRIGERLELSSDLLRWTFRRIFDWKQDQRVTDIIQKHGPAFVHHMTVADNFASEWSLILGCSHRNYATGGYCIDRPAVCTHPAYRLLTHADNQALLSLFTEVEVLKNIASLGRHKTAVPDGLNNDFYKDTPALLVLPLCRPAIKF